MPLFVTQNWFYTLIEMEYQFVGQRQDVKPFALTQYSRLQFDFVSKSDLDTDPNRPGNELGNL